MPSPRRIVVFLLALSWLVVPQPAAHAQATLSYTGLVDGESRSATVPLLSLSGTEYVPLAELVSQLGGSALLQPVRVLVDFPGKSASLTVNNTVVSTSTERFNLEFPILLRDGKPYIAAADTAMFFDRAFQTALRQGNTSATPEGEEPLSTSDLAALSVAETSPLEPMVLDPEPVAPDPQETAQAAAPSLGQISTIVLDAGHGGTDAGTQGSAGVMEKDIALDVALRIQKALGQVAGLKVVLTRDEDRFLPVARRVELASREPEALLISIHSGASFAARANGAEVFYRDDSPRNAPRASAQSRVAAVAIEHALRVQANLSSRGTHAVPLRLFQGLSGPGVLVEVGFVTNPAEEGLLATESHRAAIADSIAAAIKELTAS